VNSPTADDGGLSERLLAWARVHGRAYPWRRSTNLYHLVVAEVLLQKTQGNVVVPVWRELIERWPSSDDLQKADRQAILSLLSPLGLGSQRLQRLLSATEAGHWSLADGGLGPYARGVLQLTETPALRTLTPPIDGNIARVATRAAGLRFDRGEPRKKSQVRDWVSQQLSNTAGTEGIELIYALVDLGYRVCTPHGPKCDSCPISSACRSAGTVQIS